jgi:hypothetical protein
MYVLTKFDDDLGTDKIRHHGLLVVMVYGEIDDPFNLSSGAGDANGNDSLLVELVS